MMRLRKYTSYLIININSGDNLVKEYKKELSKVVQYKNNSKFISIFRGR